MTNPTEEKIFLSIGKKFFFRGTFSSSREELNLQEILIAGFIIGAEAGGGILESDFISLTTSVRDATGLLYRLQLDRRAGAWHLFPCPASDMMCTGKLTIL